MDAMTAKPLIAVDVWFDARCPWCYIGKVRFDRALEIFHERHTQARVEVRHRSYLLSPNMPDRFAGGEAEYLHQFEGVPIDLARQQLPALERMAEAERIPLTFDGLQLVSTWPSHRVFQYAQAEGRGEAFLSRLFAAYFVEHRDLAEPEELGAIAADARLDAAAAAQAAGHSALDNQIKQDWRRAQMLGVNGVPYFLFNSAYEVRGAVETPVFVRALERIMELEARRQRPATDEDE